MRFDILTLFPNICEVPLRQSICGRARERGLVDIVVTDVRDFTRDRHRTADDKPYGGGAGMVLKPEPLLAAVDSVKRDDSHVVLLSPQGHRFQQRDAERLASTHDHLILLCGHYEGVDERVRQTVVDEEISIGDYILTNGTLAALVVVDAVVRLVPGVLGSAASVKNESFGAEELLEYPHYTRPPELGGLRVPQTLLSGDHQRIELWRRKQRIIRTASRRPDLMEQKGGDGT